MIDHLLAVVPVSEFGDSLAWYTRLFGREADNVPMPGLLAEWRVVDTGWVQVTLDPVRAGSTLLNFAVPDLDARRHELARAGLAPEEIVAANRGVRLCGVTDPDGNRLTFIDGFRENY